MVPGGSASPDKLRGYDAVTDLGRGIDKLGKIVVAICHAGWVLMSAEVVKGREITWYYAIMDDMVNAGVHYRDDLQL